MPMIVYSLKNSFIVFKITLKCFSSTTKTVVKMTMLALIPRDCMDCLQNDQSFMLFLTISRAATMLL